MKEKSKYETASYAIKPKSNANCSTQKMIKGLVEESDDFEKMCMESE